MSLRPFWRYFGGKWRIAPRYPAPYHETIVEPFAGAAGYSLRHHRKKVLLFDVFEPVIEVWRYLIGVRSSEIRSIPLVESVDDLPGSLPQEAKWLVGWQMNSASVQPCKNLSKGRKEMAARGSTREGWNEAQRDLVASQVNLIRHWVATRDSYECAPDIEATWFVDPPYQRAGVYYVHGSRTIDYDSLGSWCRLRRGQTIVCEADGANWLPFRPMIRAKAAMGRSALETVWTSGCEPLFDQHKGSTS